LLLFILYEEREREEAISLEERRDERRREKKLKYIEEVF